MKESSLFFGSENPGIEAFPENIIDIKWFSAVIFILVLSGEKKKFLEILIRVSL